MAATKKTTPQTSSGDSQQTGAAVTARFDEIRGEAETLAHSVGEAAHDVSDILRRQLEERPYTTLGLAAGAGFVLGGGLSVSVTRSLISAGSKMLASRVLQEVLKPL